MFMLRKITLTALTALAIAAPHAAALDNVVPAVAQRSEVAGWPHSVTTREANAITRHTLRDHTARLGDGRILPGTNARCFFPNAARLSVARCSVTLIYRVPGSRYNTRIVVYPNMRFYEDGSYRLSYGRA